MEKIRKKHTIIRKYIDKRRLFAILWGGVLVFLLIQHRAVYMHFDDFGYASLSYGYVDNANGMNWNAGDLIKFLNWHYFNWGGRVLYFGIYTVVLRLGEPIMQIFQALVLWGICFLSYTLVKRRTKDVPAALISLTLYASMGIGVVADGLFWYTASAIYVWPFLAFLIGLLLLERGMFSKRDTIWAAVAMFFAGFSQEQIAVSVIVFFIVYLVYYRLVYKKIDNNSIVVAISGCLGALVEIFAPGNFSRADENVEFYKLNILQKTQKNLPKILDINLNSNNLIWVIVLSVLLLTLGYFLLKLNSKYRWIEILNVVVAVGVMLVLGRDSTELFVVLVRGFFVALVLVETFFYLIQNQKMIFIALLIGGICSQGMMIFSPSVDYRSALPFQIIMHIICAYVLVSIIPERKKVIMYLTMAVMIVMSGINVGYITYGYFKNMQLNEINRRKLEEKSARIAAGVKVDSIILYRLPDDKFATQMPYHQEFIQVWVKNYYEIPQTVTFIWQDLNQAGNSYEIVEAISPVISSIWPDEVNDKITRTEDNGINFAVTPEVMDSNLTIVVDGEEVPTTIGKGVVTAHIAEEYLQEEVNIQIKDKSTGKISDSVVMKVVQ